MGVFWGVGGKAEDGTERCAPARAPPRSEMELYCVQGEVEVAPLLLREGEDNVSLRKYTIDGELLELGGDTREGGGNPWGKEGGGLEYC